MSVYVFVTGQQPFKKRKNSAEYITYTVKNIHSVDKATRVLPRSLLRSPRQPSLTHSMHICIYIYLQLPKPSLNPPMPHTLLIYKKKL